VDRTDITASSGNWWGWIQRLARACVWEGEKLARVWRS